MRVSLRVDCSGYFSRNVIVIPDGYAKHTTGRNFDKQAAYGWNRCRAAKAP
jgi:hypothetical protein